MKGKLLKLKRRLRKLKTSQHTRKGQRIVALDMAERLLKECKEERR